MPWSRSPAARARRAPVPAPAGDAALAVAGVSFAAIAAGVSEENPATLAAGFTVVYALGRMPGGRRPTRRSSCSRSRSVVTDGFTAADAVFVMFILTATWTCGRPRPAPHGAGRETGGGAPPGLAERDPAVLAAEVVAEERARLAGEALAVIRRAVEAMHRDAVAAEPELDPRRLAAIQAGGRAAVAELRRLLGLLRSETGDDRRVRRHQADEVDERPRRVGRRRPRGGADGARARRRRGLGDGRRGGVRRAARSRRRRGGARTDRSDRRLRGLAALPSVAAAAFDAPLAYGFATAVSCGVLAWWAGADGRPRALFALAVLAAVTLVVVNADSPGNEGILLGALAIDRAAGNAWGRRDREGRAASATAAQLRAEHEAAAERAVRAERLRLARELHDVASHAVGAMVLQAGAALALRERDPAGARAAVRTVQAAGSEAMAELTTLFGLLDAGAVGPAGHAAPATERDLGALAARMRAGGLAVELAGAGGCPPIPHSPPPPTGSSRRRSPTRRATRPARAWRCAVEDDGEGLDVEDRRRRAGLGAAGRRRVRARRPRRARARAGRRASAGPRPGGGFRSRRGCRIAPARTYRPRATGPRTPGRGAGVIRVVIADDQDLIRGGLRAILDAEDDIEVVARPATAPARPARSRRAPPTWC